MRNIMVFLIILPIVFAGLIVLQIFLAKKESKWAGLILPIIFFIVSLIFVLNVALINEISTVIVTIVSAFLLGNIPTAVFLVIYAVCRGKRNKQRALDKMSVQDLE